MGSRQALAAGGVYSARDRDGRILCHTVLWHQICAAGRVRRRFCREPGRRRREDLAGMVYFYWIAGTILALAWFSRIVDAALGMPSVADVSRPEWDRNPI